MSYVHSEKERDWFCVCYRLFVGIYGHNRSAMLFIFGHKNFGYKSFLLDINVKFYNNGNNILSILVKSLPKLGTWSEKYGFLEGFKRLRIAGIAVEIISAIAFFVGLLPFDFKPSFWKVLIEGVIYYIGVAIMEELYVRGSFLNILEKVFSQIKHNTLIAIVISSVVFGFGHIFGVLDCHFM